MNKYIPMIIIAILMGTLARISLLRVDYRQYPSYPQGYIAHLTLGLVAASLGAVAIPAILEKDFSAMTFLSLAASQFRDIRNMERQSLDNVEENELVPRGKAYIEDIAKAFETRNYIALLTALITSIGIQLYKSYIHSTATSFTLLLVGGSVGLICIILLNILTKGKVIEDIADVKSGKINFKGPLLCVDDIVIMNIGLNDSKKLLLEKALAIIIVPKDDDARATLANVGLRQAIQHNAASQLGIRKDVDEPDFTPLARRDPENGNVGMVILAMEPDIECFIESVKRVPVLESAKRKPLQSRAGKKAAD